MSDNLQITPEKVGLLLRLARGKLSREKAVRLGKFPGGEPISASTLQNWEDGKAPEAMRQFIYLRGLAARSDAARDYVLEICGLGTATGTVDHDLEEKLALVRAAHNHESAAVRSLMGTLEVLLKQEESKRA